MSITNSVKNILLGYGNAGLSNSAVTSTTITTSTVTATATLPASALANYGAYRCKVSNVDGSHAVNTLVFTATDGTSTIFLGAPVTIATTVNGQGIDYQADFVSDLNLRTFVATITGTASISTMTVDFEVYGNEAAGGP